MPTAIDVLIAAIPLIVVAVLLVGLLWPATRAMPIAWIVALGVGFFAWNMPAQWLAAASIVGVMTALSILWIVFGALVLLYTLMQAGAFDRINEGFVAVSDDRRVQIVLLGFLLATFIEGAAGFGTPAAVVAPLLLGLGFPALAAVIAALIGHIIAVTYGAVGTPIIVGIHDPLDDLASTQTAILDAGYPSVMAFANEVAAWAATYHMLAGFLMPLFAVGMVVYFFDSPDNRSLKPMWEVAPLCVFAGIAFAIPYWLSAWFITAEFPSLIGAMVGGAIVVGALRRGYFLPDTEWEFPDRSEWPDHWVGEIEPGDSTTIAANSGGMSLLKAWSPYIILVVLLIITRVIDSIAEFLTTTLVIEWTDILGTTLNSDIAWMHLPGTWLIISALIAVPLFGMDRQQVRDAWYEAGEKLVAPFIALVFVIAMVQVMLQSGTHPGAPEFGSMIVVLATATAETFGAGYPFFAPVVGALAAALVGSNTVSNITFGVFQFEIAGRLGVSHEVLLGSQAVGGAIGNLVAIHNVVAALATVGLVGQEGRVIRLNLIPLFYYTIAVGFWTMLFLYVMPDVLPAVFDVF